MPTSFQLPNWRGRFYRDRVVASLIYYAIYKYVSPEGWAVILSFKAFPFHLLPFTQVEAQHMFGYSQIHYDNSVSLLLDYNKELWNLISHPHSTSAKQATALPLPSRNSWVAVGEFRWIRIMSLNAFGEDIYKLGHTTPSTRLFCCCWSSSFIFVFLMHYRRLVVAQ